MNVVEACAAGIGGVGDMHPAAGQPPDQKAVDGAETQFAGGGAVARALNLVQNPGQFRGGEIGIQKRPVFSVTMASLPAFFITAQMSAVRRSCQTMALWIGLPVARSQMTAVSRWLVMPMAIGMLPRDRASATMADVTSMSCLPDIFRIVFDPAVSRKMLRELGGLLRQNRAGFVKQDGA